jgi:integrase
MKWGRRAQRDQHTFGEYAQHYLDNAEIAFSTRNSYRDAINIYWLPTLHHRPLASVDFAELREIDLSIDWPSAKTRENALIPLRQIFKAALEDQLISVNPAIGFRRRRHQKPEPDPFTESEVATLLRWLDETPAGLYFRLAFGTGARTGELLALNWKDFDGETVSISKSIVRGREKASTKTYRARRVVLPSDLCCLLENQRQPSGSIVANQYGRRYQSGYHLNRWLRQASSKLGIRERSGPYPWRHTYASTGLSRGLPPAFLAKQLGHNVNVLLSTYGRWLPSDGDKALVEKLTQSWRLAEEREIRR